MQTDSTISSAVIGLLAAVVGGAIQAFASRRSEAKKFEQESKWELYSKFFSALAELANSEPIGDRRVNARALMAQVKGRIGVVGSPDVIEAVVKVFRFSDLSGEEAQEAMAVALFAMRQDVGSKGRRVSRTVLSELMFGS